jgi:hypothetical protein
MPSIEVHIYEAAARASELDPRPRLYDRDSPNAPKYPETAKRPPTR